MGKRRCQACQKWFPPCRHVPDQTFCSKRDCQRERRRRWQQHKRKTDPDYRLNQAQAQQRWRQAHPEYWRNYRQDHPEYAERNRLQQRERDRRRRAPPPPPAPRHPSWACKDGRADPSDGPVFSGTYQLIPVRDAALAKMDAYLVQIAPISAPSAPP